MKKGKIKKLVKSARRTAVKNIKQSLIAELKTVTGKLGQASNKLEKKIEKGSTQLAKKLSKEIKINKSALMEGNNQSKGADVPKIPIAANSKGKAISSGTTLLSDTKQGTRTAASSKLVTPITETVQKKSKYQEIKNNGL